MVLLKKAKLSDKVVLCLNLNGEIGKPTLWACNNDSTVLSGVVDEALTIEEVDFGYYSKNYKEILEQGYFSVGSITIKKLIQPEWNALVNFWLGERVTQQSFEIMQGDQSLRDIADEICNKDPMSATDPIGCKSALLKKRMIQLRENAAGTGLNLEPTKSHVILETHKILDIKATITARPSISW